MHFPNTYLLNGSDYFQVFLDEHHRRYGYRGNVSRLVMSIEGRPDWQSITNDIINNPFVQWLCTLRLQTSNFFRFPRWKQVGETFSDIQRHVIYTENVFDAKHVFAKDIRSDRESSLQFDFIEMPTSSAIVFSWNHIVMDARGIETLMHAIINKEEITYFNTATEDNLPWKQRLVSINKVKDFLLPNVKNGISKFANEKMRKENAYHVLQFTKEETKQIDATAQVLKVGIAKSSFYLAATQMAFAENNMPTEPAWIPVPQDQRRKGQLGPIMANQVSFLFYSAKPDNDSVASLVTSFRNQMMNQMRARLQQDYHVMMDSMRRFPSWLYRHLVASPTSGALASYFYSDTGYSLEGIGAWHGCKITDATHYPPNSAFPGLTIIFMRFDDRQKVIMSYPDDDTHRRRINKLANDIRNNLLGKFTS